MWKLWRIEGKVFKMDPNPYSDLNLCVMCVLHLIIKCLFPAIVLLHFSVIVFLFHKFCSFFLFVCLFVETFFENLSHILLWGKVTKILQCLSSANSLYNNLQICRPLLNFREPFVNHNNAISLIISCFCDGVTDVFVNMALKLLNTLATSSWAIFNLHVSTVYLKPVLPFTLLTSHVPLLSSVCVHME